MTNEELQRLAESKVWSIEALLEYINMRFILLDQQYEKQFGHIRQSLDLALTAADKALAKAETSTEKRFDAVNEFRSVLADQQRLLMTRSEYDSTYKSVIEKIDTLTVRMERSESLLSGERRGGSNVLSYVVGVFGVLLTIISALSLVVSLAKG